MWIDISQRRYGNVQQAHEKMFSIYESSEQCKSKPQWDIISSQLECLLLQRQKSKCWQGGRETLTHYISRNIN
jgi:hypothetical protein